MPKRSNDFQKLIYLIHHQLAKDAVVTESKLLLDRAANVNREVDIVIEKQVGEYKITISIECQGRGRVANVEWVEQMITKHQTLPTDKLILVSQSGFTETAKKKAKALGIETMALDRAIQTNWESLLEEAKLLFEKWAIEPSVCFALVALPEGHQHELELDFGQQLYLELEEEQEIFTAKEIIDIFIAMNHEQIVLDITGPEYKNRSPYTIFEIRFSLPVKAYMDISGTKHEIIEFFLIGHCTREAEQINMQIASFGTTQIAFGKTEAIDAKSLVSIIEREDTTSTAAIMLNKKDKDINQVVDLREIKEEDFIHKGMPTIPSVDDDTR